MVAVITINYNLHADTIDCVNSLLESDFHDYLIFLIDNGSEPSDYNHLIEIYKNETRVRLLRIEKNRGYVGGVNFGLEQAAKTNPDYFMIMNNDTIIDKNAISALVNTAEKYGQKAIVSGKVYYYDHPDVLQHTGVVFTDHRYLKTSYPGKNEKDVGQCDQEIERDSLDDVFWLLPAKIIADIGLYSDYFFLYAEQGDYAQRARRKGYKLIYTPTAKIWHKESMTSGGGNPQAQPICYWRGKSAIIFFYRNLKRKYFLQLIIRSIFKNTIKFILSKGDEKKCNKARLLGYLAGIRWLFNKKPDNGYNPYIK